MSKMASLEVPVVAHQVKDYIHKDAVLIPGLTQWVKDLVLPQAVMYVADSAQICRCRCRCGIGQWLQLL